MERLRQLREEKGLTQREFAELFHISQQSLYKYETGISLPPIAFLQEVSHFFDISVDSIINNKSQYTPDVPVKLSAVEYQFIENYRKLPPKNKSMLLKITSMLCDTSGSDIHDIRLKR